MGAIIMCVLSIAILCGLAGISGEGALIIGVMGTVAVIGWLVINESTNQQAEEEKKEEIKNSSEYSKYIQKYKKLITKYKGSEYYLKAKEKGGTRHYAILDNNIHIIEDLNEEELIKKVAASGMFPNEKVYNIDEIRYYTIEGSVYQQQHISGGGGGGSSIKGAVVGSLIAGDAGAVIGSRKKIDDVQTTYVEEDDRRVVITFIDDDELEVSYKFYDRLLDYIPEKDYENYIAIKKAKGKK